MLCIHTPQTICKPGICQQSHLSHLRLRCRTLCPVFAGADRKSVLSLSGRHVARYGSGIFHGYAHGKNIPQKALGLLKNQIQRRRLRLSAVLSSLGYPGCCHHAIYQSIFLWYPETASPSGCCCHSVGGCYPVSPGFYYIRHGCTGNEDLYQKTFQSL